MKIAYAAEVVNIDEVIDSITDYFPKFRFSSSSRLADILTPALYFVYAIAGFGLLIFLVRGGLGYLTSGGDPKKAEAAKNTITTALIGFLIIFSGFWLTQIVGYIFGLGSAF